MAWKEVSRSGIDIKKNKNKAYVGEYIGHDEIDTKIGKQTVYKFRDEQGNPFSIYGFTNLNIALEAIREGTLCRMTYLGTENVKTKFGMKDVHQVRVEIDSEEEERATSAGSSGSDFIPPGEGDLEPF